MSYDYSENILVQESAGHLLEQELGWDVAFAAKSAVFAQLLGVIGKGNLPSQLILEQMACAFLDENIFGVVVTHTYASFLREFRSKIHKFNNIRKIVSDMLC